MKIMIMMCLILLAGIGAASGTRRCAGTCVCMAQRLVRRRTLPAPVPAPNRIKELDLQGVPPYLLSGVEERSREVPQLGECGCECVAPEPSLILLSDCGSTTQGKTRECMYSFFSHKLRLEISLSDVNECFV